MAVIQGVVNTVKGIAPTLRITGNSQAARAEIRPLDLETTDGAFRLAARSGALTGTGIVAAAPLFSFRYAPGTTNTVCVVTRIRAGLDVTTIFTAAQEVAIEAIRATAWSASDSAGTSVLPTNVSNKFKTTMPGTTMTDIRIGSTTLLTAGTRTLDSQAFSTSNSVGERVVNAAAATAYLPSPPQAVLDFNPNQWEYPLVLVNQEGFVIRNVVAFPAAGAATMWVEVSWMEMASTSWQ